MILKIIFKTFLKSPLEIISIEHNDTILTPHSLSCIETFGTQNYQKSDLIFCNKIHIGYTNYAFFDTEFKFKTNIIYNKLKPFLEKYFRSMLIKEILE